MTARHILRALWSAIVLGAVCLGTAAAQSSTSPVPDANSAPADYSSSSTAALPSDGVVESTANDAQSPDTPFTKLRSAMPLKMDPGGYRMGPVHVIQLSSSGFYGMATPPGQKSQSYLGSSFGSEMVYAHPLSNGLLAFQASPDLYVSNGSAYVNVDTAFNFSKQLTPRWSMSANVQWTFFQNEYLLQTPEYLLAYAAGGIVVQSVYAQRNGSTMYMSDGFAVNYQINGRTQLSLSPSVNLSLSDTHGTTYLTTQLGGGATLTRSFTPNRSGFVYANMNHASSLEAQANGNSGWNTFSVGGGFNQKIGNSWFLAGSLGLSEQSGLMWTGGASVLKTFHKNTISAAYSRNTATQTLLSSGYFDQADVAFARQFGRKVSANINLAAFRGIETGNHNRGKRASASVSYGWRPNVAWFLTYSYTNQVSNQVTLYSGTTNYVTAGLTWTLGHPVTR